MVLHTLLRVRRLLSLLLALTLMLLSAGALIVAAQATPGTVLAATPSDDGSMVTFNPVADTYVLEDSPEENYGDSTVLSSDQDPMSIAYLQFEIAGVEEHVGDATLRVWVTDSSTTAPVLWISPPVPLDEHGVTWATRPALDAVVEVKQGQSAPDGRWLEYDVGSVVDGDGLYTFALVPASTSGMEFVSREGEERKPELRLWFGEGRPTVGESDPDRDPILLAAGDIAVCDTEGAEMTARILDEEPGIIAALGDNAYNEGTAEQFKECYDPTWGRHKGRTMPVPGNHEYYTDEAQPYFDYFGEVAGESGEGYYSYMLGDWKIIAINTNIQTEPDSDQMEWLRAELDASDAQCTLVYGHHPRFSSGEHGSQDFMDPFFTLFYDYGVEIYLAGHEHSYERFRPQNPAGQRDEDHGVRQFIVGTGGVGLRGFETSLENSEVRSGDAWGVIRFDLYEDGYEFEFLAVEDATFYDSGDGECRDAPDEPWPAEEHGRLPDAYVAREARWLSGWPATLHRVSM